MPDEGRLSQGRMEIAKEKSKRGAPALAYLLSIGGIVLLLDQLTKLLVLRFMPLYTMKEIIPGFFNLVHVRNTGAAFSFLAGASSTWRQAFFVIVSLIGVSVITYAYRKVDERDRWNKTALALLFGGALGNLVDRLRLGEVVDFLDFYIASYHWPAFNVADSAITVGACILVIVLLKKG